MTITTDSSRPHRDRTPNCRPGDPEDAPGLHHDWQLVDDSHGSHYRCPRCGQEGWD